MKRPSFLNKHRTTNNNGYELNTSTSYSSSSDTPTNNNTNNREEKVVLSSISVLCNESKSHTKKHNSNRSSSQDVPSNSSSNNSSSPHSDGGIISSNNCGSTLALPLLGDDNTNNHADEIILNSTTLLNNISLEDSYSTSEEAAKASVAVFVDPLGCCVAEFDVPSAYCFVDTAQAASRDDKQKLGSNTSCKQSTKKSTTSVEQPTVNAIEEVEGRGEVSPTNVTEFNVSFGSADFDYFVDNRFTDLSANDDNDDEQEHEKTGEKKTEKKTKKTGESSMNNEKTDNVRYTMVDNNKASKEGGKKVKKKEGNNTSSNGIAEFSNTYNDDTFSVSLASTTNSNGTSSYTHQQRRQASIESSASQQYINEHIQILLETTLLPITSVLPNSIKNEVTNTILPAFKSTSNDITNNIELILTLPADYIVNALNTSTSNNEMKKVDSKMKNVSSFVNSVNAGYVSVSKSILLNESNISNETIKTSNLLLCGSGSGVGNTSCIERDFLYNTCVDQ